ncbi:nitrilase-related carbon-nitrogen hydrolase [Chloroflexota bacterium]
MTSKYKAMVSVLSTALVVCIVTIALLVGGIIGVSAGDPIKGPPPFPGDGKDYQPPLPLGYEVVPLDCEEVKVAAIQMQRVPVNYQNPGPGIAANLEHMLELCDAAAAQGVRLAAFNEFTLNGTPVFEDRQVLLDGAAISVPGPEIDAISAKAQEHGMYIVFASIWQEPEEWPGHFFNGGIIIGPSGDIILKHWKSYFGYPGIGLEYSTTVYDVLDEFVKRYGWDAVNPVVRTPIGNLAVSVCSESFFNSAELPRIYAMKGCEVYIRMYGGSGWKTWQGRMMNLPIGEAAQNLIWVVSTNNANDTEPDDPSNSMWGSSQIIDPCGNVKVRSNTIREEIVTWTIPIADFRRPGNDNPNNFDHYGNPHLSPNYYRGGLRNEIFIREYEQFSEQFPPKSTYRIPETSPWGITSHLL